MINCYILHCHINKSVLGGIALIKALRILVVPKLDGWWWWGQANNYPPLLLLTQVITFPNLSIWNPMVKCDIWPSLMVFFVWDQRRPVKMSRWWSVAIESSWWAEQERSIILTNPSILTHFWSSSHRPFVRAFANIFYKYRSSSIFC